MNARDLIAKASRAAVSARLLLDAGDLNGACNRAYYAMFDAARAALIDCGAAVHSEVGRTHSGLISAFSLHLVKTGRIPNGEEAGPRAANAVRRKRHTPLRVHVSVPLMS